MAARILFLDDMPDRHQLFDRYAAKVGAEVTHAWTAPEAIGALEKGGLDVVYLDHDLAEQHYLVMSGGLSETLEHREGCPTAKDWHDTCTCGAREDAYRPGTGMDVVDHLVRMPFDRRPTRVVIHSWNIPRAQEMARRLRDAGVMVTQFPFQY